MILYVCASLECRTVLRVMGKSVDETQCLVGEASEWWPNQFRCPSCNGEATGMYELQTSPGQFKGFNVVELEAQDYFRFMMGIGLPKESDCRVEVLQEIFHEGKVKSLAGHRIMGTNRFCVEWLEMENGTRLYFGASSHGATIYRITEKTDFVKGVTDAV